MFLIWGQSDFAFSQTATPDTARSLNPYKTVTRSLILPGWGQLNQERLPEAALFYAVSAHFYYNAFFQYYHYRKGKAKKRYYAFRRNLSAALFTHLVNVVDAADVAFRLKPKGWQGGLLSDKPLKSPWGAALRSAMLPGWGQVYIESYLKAVGFLLADGYLFYKSRQADIRYRRTKETRYRDDRSRYNWYFGLAYLLTVADAYAGAYLYRFDDAIRLTVVPMADKSYLGIYFNVSF